MNYENIRLETRGPVALITLNRPKAFNALSNDLMDELTHALDAVETDMAIRAIVPVSYTHLDVYKRQDASIDYQVVELTKEVLALAVALAGRRPLRGYDAVQLAAALAVNHIGVASGLPPLTFVSADARLNQIAGDEGLPVDDPNQHP